MQEQAAWSRVEQHSMGIFVQIDTVYFPKYEFFLSQF